MYFFFLEYNFVPEVIWNTIILIFCFVFCDRVLLYSKVTP